eukprot:scaffold113_cov339-Pavlova_lutheri.AAC.11
MATGERLPRLKTSDKVMLIAKVATCIYASIALAFGVRRRSSFNNSFLVVVAKLALYRCYPSRKAASIELNIIGVESIFFVCWQHRLGP